MVAFLYFGVSLLSCFFSLGGCCYPPCVCLSAFVGCVISVVCLLFVVWFGFVCLCIVVGLCSCLY